MNDVPQPTDEKNDKEDNKINKKGKFYGLARREKMIFG